MVASGARHCRPRWPHSAGGSNPDPARTWSRAAVDRRPGFARVDASRSSSAARSMKVAALALKNDASRRSTRAPGSTLPDNHTRALNTVDPHIPASIRVCPGYSHTRHGTISATARLNSFVGLLRDGNAVRLLPRLYSLFLPILAGTHLRNPGFPRYSCGTAGGRSAHGSSCSSMA